MATKPGSAIVYYEHKPKRPPRKIKPAVALKGSAIARGSKAKAVPRQAVEPATDAQDVPGSVKAFFRRMMQPP